MRILEFYFDFQSPYSYFAYIWLKEKQDFLRKSDITIKFVPVFLASIIKNYETKGPAEIKPKRDYLFKSCLRIAKHDKIPFALPKTLPFNSLYILRMVEGAADKEKFSLIDLFFKSGWQYGKDLGTEESLKEILKANNYNLELFDHCTSKEVRSFMKKNQTQAISKGVFGVPTFVIEGELFWGHDSLPYLEDFINNRDLLDLKAYDYFLQNYFIES